MDLERRMAMGTSLGKIAAAFGAVAVMGVAPAFAAVTGSFTSNDPDPFEIRVAPSATGNGSLNTSVNITGGAGSGAADVFFVVDTTGSMGSFIGTAQSVFTDVTNLLGASNPGVSFRYGVSEYKDAGDGGIFE